MIIYLFLALAFLLDFLPIQVGQGFNSYSLISYGLILSSFALVQNKKIGLVIGLFFLLIYIFHISIILSILDICLICDWKAYSFSYAMIGIWFTTLIINLLSIYQWTKGNVSGFFTRSRFKPLIDYGIISFTSVIIIYFQFRSW